MKKILATIIALALISPVIAQNDTIQASGDVPKLNDSIKITAVVSIDTVTTDEDITELQDSLIIIDEEDIVFSTPDKMEVTFGENEVFIIEESGDTTKFKLGNKGMSIVESDDGYTINIVEMDENDKEESEDQPKNKSKKKFKPNYAGLEIGLNNYLNPDHSLHTGTFMNLNTAKSWNYNINFLEYGIELGTSYAGLVTGMGFEISNYVFDGENSIEEVDGNIVSRPIPLSFTGITKSKLSMTYLTVPLIFEFQIPAGKKRVHISGGVIGGVKLGSKTKIKSQDGGKQKDVRKDDFSLSPLRYGATFRIGYRALNIFANYYFSPLFGETSTPELYPFSVGLTLIKF